MNGGTANPLYVTMDDAKAVTAVFAPLGADFITVQILSADVTEDCINVTFRPEQRRGVFTLKLIGPEAQHTIRTVQDKASGSYAETFDIPNLAVGNYSQVYASWEVDGELATDTFDYHIRVLGNYNHTRYNAPEDTGCSGDPTPFCYTTGDCHDTACDWHTDGTGPSKWLSEVDENGSGYHSTLGWVTREGYCREAVGHGPPEGCAAFFLRDVTEDGCTFCGLGLLEDETVAINKDNEFLACTDRVYAHTVGVRTVGDHGGLVGLTQLDHYAGLGPCNSVGTIGQRMTIKLFDD